MRCCSLVHRCFLYALFMAGFVASGPILGSGSVAGAAGESGGALPTLGGENAFATKADAMASTVEGFLQIEDYESATKAAVELTTKDPSYLKGWMLLGYCYSRTRKFAASNEAYDKAFALGADGQSILTRKAYNFVRLGDFDEARACYREVLERYGDDHDALKQLGFLEGKLGNYDEAAHYYRRILDEDSENAEVVSALAKIEEKRGGNGAVKELLEKSLEIDPDNTDALGRLGLLYIKEKKYAESIVPLERLVELEPENIKARRNLGVAYYHTGAKKKACGEFSAVRKLGGEMDDLYGPLADCHLASGQKSEALAIVKEGIERGAQEAWLYCIWGNILEDYQNYDGAISKFAKAAALRDEPWSGYARKQIGRQEKLKKRAEIIANQQGM